MSVIFTSWGLQTYLNLNWSSSITINPQLSSIRLVSCLVRAMTCKYASVTVSNIAYHKHACPCPNHGCGHRWLRRNHIPFQWPRNSERLISFLNKANKLCHVSFIYWLIPKSKRNNFWRFWNERQKNIITVLSASCSSLFPPTINYHWPLAQQILNHYQQCWKQYKCKCHCDDIPHYWSSIHSFLSRAWLWLWMALMIPRHLS